MITFEVGNLLLSDAQALVNTVNTEGVMGKGIALQFKEEFPNNYAIYRFGQGERVDINDASHLVTITPDTHYELPQAESGSKCVYAVTALDRMQNESSYKKVKVKY